MNLGIFQGRLVRDPELRKVNTANGEISVVSFSLAIDSKRNKDETTFLDFEAWAQGAETIAKWFKKGDLIIIRDSEARNDKWQDKTTGENRSRVKFRVNEFMFAPINKGRPQEEPDAGTPKPEEPGTPVRQAKKPRKPARQTVPAEDDSEIPF